MSIKPSVVFIKGVHSATGHDTASDIGFPQLELEKLFEGATIKVTADTAYDSSKQYIYYNSPNNPVAIQDAGHFNCIKNGYYSIANGINHYYTKSGDNYSYNAVPSNVNTWAGKWSFSNTIKNKDLYSISSESERICVGNTYYKKNGNNYVKQTQEIYDLYEDNIVINWGESNKYTCKTTRTVNEETGQIESITKWQNKDKSLAESGYYLSVIKNEVNAGDVSIQYEIELLNIIFNDGVWESNSGISSAALYRLDIESVADLYIKNGNSLSELIVNMGSITLNFDPATIDYIYHKFSSYSYPNIEEPETAAIYTDSHNNWYEYNTNSFPVYNSVSLAMLDIIEKPSYTIYEKTAVKINYNYSGDANSLKFIFTDKDIDGVLTACNLPNNIKKYVHLTNLKYNEN